jgi:hypothetical protein
MEILNMKSDVDNTFSFWQLINRYKIEIPIIQRDYAQGRKDDKADSIREKIIQDIVCALSCIDKPLSFDFVYGRVADGMFVPIDGQQRLTTLWLLHVYLFKRCFAQQKKSCGKECPHLKSGILNRFTYATRQSSREFCEAVVKEDILDPQDKLLVSVFVKNQHWFYPDWATDPTVDGMLRTLDHINGKLLKDKINHADLLNKLLKECPITFQFLDMREHGLTDDLYLNMNARGLPLTEFENFKASLEKYLSNRKNRDALIAIVDSLKPKNENDTTWDKIFTHTPEKKITWKLEHDWHDLFWETLKPDPIKTEQDMLSLFRRHFLNVWRLHNDNEGDESKALTPPVTGVSFTPFSVYETVLDKCGIDAALKPIFNLFEALAQYGKNITDTKPSWPEKEAWSALERKGNEKQETYLSRVRFFAVMKCFAKPIIDVYHFVTPEENVDNKYKEWMRIVGNILENNEVDSEKVYQSALQLIDELGNYWQDILPWLSNDENQIVSPRSREQILEERQKAKKIHEFRDTIKSAESVFKGAIRFLYRDGEEKLDWDNFKTKKENACQYFTSDGLKSEKAVEFVTAFIKQFPSWIDNDRYLFNINLAAWKILLLDPKFKASCHNIFMTKDLSSLPVEELNGEMGQQMRIKTQLLAGGVVEYLLGHYADARFRWLDDGFRLYERNQRRHQHILFDTVGNRRNEMIVRCLGDFNLKPESLSICNSDLFIGEDIPLTTGKVSEHKWLSPMWKMNWRTVYKHNSGELVIKHQEQHTLYEVTVCPILTDDGDHYAISFSLHNGKDNGEVDTWIEKVRSSLPLEKLSLEGTRHCLNKLSVEDTISCVHIIINQPFS